MSTWLYHGKVASTSDPSAVGLCLLMAVSAVTLYRKIRTVVFEV